MVLLGDGEFDGVDLQRGPNSILFGQGSPAGIINTRTKTAAFKDSNEVSVRVGSFGSTRETVDFNKVLGDNAQGIRKRLGDGNFGGYYERSDTEMMALWNVAVEETRTMIETNWG